MIFTVIPRNVVFFFRMLKIGTIFFMKIEMTDVIPVWPSNSAITAGDEHL